MELPDFRDVLLAQRRIRPYLPRTPMHTYPAINALLGTEVYIKHENYQAVGAFKVRGGVNVIAQRTARERAHGACAARLFGITAHIVVPEQASPGKVAAMQGMGVDVIVHGDTFDEASVQCEALARDHGYRYIHSGDEPLLIT